MARIVYHKTARGTKYFKIGKGQERRWLMLRQQIDQAITHDRIETTWDKARHFRPTLERVITLAKKFVETKNEHYFRKVNGYLTTRYAIDRLFLEILPRLQEKQDNYVNVRPTTRRKGDNVLKGILELHGNAIQKYEQAKQVTINGHFD